MIVGEALTVLATFLLLGAGLGFGGSIDKFLPASVGAIEHLALRILAGLGLLSLFLFLLGQFIFTPLTITIIVGIGLVLNFVWRPWSSQEEKHSPKLIDWRNGGIVIAGVVLLVLAVASLAKPVGGFGNDAISYHLLGPVKWLAAGRIRPVLDSSLTAFPATAETLFAAVMAISRYRTPGLLGVMFGAILMAQTWGLAKRLGGDNLAASLSTGLAATMPVVMFTADLSFVDVPYAAFSLAAARIAFDSSRRSHLLVAGLFSGFAMGTKQSGIPMLIVTALCLLILKRSSTGNFALIDVCILTVTAILVSCPWYIRNFVLLGTPLYPPPPMLARLLPGRGFPLSASQSLQAYVRDRGKGLGRSPLDFLLLPIRLTYWTHRFHGAGGIGVAPLAMAPLGIFRARKQTIAKVWMLWGLAATTVWFMTQQEARFLVNVLIVVSVFTGLGAKVLIEQPGKSGRALAWIALIVSIAYGAAYLTKERLSSIRAALSQRAANQQWQAEVPFASAFDYLNRAPDVRKVLLLHPFLTPYYLDRPYLKIRGQYGERPVDGVNSFADALPRLNELGISHVMDVRYVDSDFEVTPNDSLKLVYSAEDVRIYRVKN